MITRFSKFNRIPPSSRNPRLNIIIHIFRGILTVIQTEDMHINRRTTSFVRNGYFSEQTTMTCSLTSRVTRSHRRSMLINKIKIKSERPYRLVRKYIDKAIYIYIYTRYMIYSWKKPSSPPFFPRIKKKRERKEREIRENWEETKKRDTEDGKRGGRRQPVTAYFTYFLDAWGRLVIKWSIPIKVKLAVQSGP